MQATNNENGILASPGATQTPANTPCVTSENLMAVESPQFIAMERQLQMFKAAHKSAEARGAEQLKAQQEAHEAEVYDLMAQLEVRYMGSLLVCAHVLLQGTQRVQFRFRSYYVHHTCVEALMLRASVYQ